MAGPRVETIEQAQARVDIASKQLDQAKQQLEYTKLPAPYDATVRSKSAEPGEYLNPGGPVVTIAALDKVYLRAYVNETSLGRVKLGQTVNVAGHVSRKSLSGNCQLHKQRGGVHAEIGPDRQRAREVGLPRENRA